MKLVLIGFFILINSFAASAKPNIWGPEAILPLDRLEIELDTRDYSNYLSGFSTKSIILNKTTLGPIVSIDCETSIEGVLELGMMAIGGETTGTALRTEDGLVEVDFANFEGTEKLSDLNGKRIELYGESELRHSVERGFRRVFIVEGLLLLE